MDICFQKVLIDGGSALNILFARSLKELGLKKEDLTPWTLYSRGSFLEKHPYL
jgi:hypothetical protein